MRTKANILMSFLCFALLFFSSVNNLQDKQIFEGTYDGHEDYGYNFIGINEEGEEYTKTFQSVEESLLTTFDLKSEKLQGARFKVTYTTKIKVEKDENGYDDEIEINTIVALTKL